MNFKGMENDLLKQWEDYLLSWDQAEYGNISRIVVEGKNIWRPGISLSNGVTEVTDFSMVDESR